MHHIYHFIYLLVHHTTRFSKKLLSPFLAILFVLLLASCNSINNPVIYYNSFNFSAVKSYSFYSNDSGAYNHQNLSYALRSRIELAIEKNLEVQKFNYSDINNADIIVTYHVLQNQRQGYVKKDYLDYNKSVLFCAYCLQSNVWLKEGNDWEVYPEALIIDLIDPKSQRSVWRSIYPLALDAKDNSKERNDIIVNAVNNMLSKYPKHSSGSDAL